MHVDEGGGVAGGAGEELTPVEEIEQDQPTLEQLKTRWDEERSVLAMLEKAGRASGDPVLVSSRAACENARLAWQAAKGPRPQHVSLRLAEERLERAVRARDKAATELAEFEEEYEEKRGRLEAQLAEADERLRERQSKVDEIRADVGAQASSSRPRNRQTGAEFIQSFGRDFGAALAAIAEALGTESPADGQVQLLQGRLQETVAMGSGVDDFYIGDDNSDNLSDISVTDELAADAARAAAGSGSGRVEAADLQG